MNESGRKPIPEAPPQRRSYYRIVYPIPDRPSIFVRNKKFSVIDLCEKGVRFEYKAGDALPFNTRLGARIVFHDGEQILVHGKIIRIEPDAIALFLSGEIPLARIIKEQRYLIQKYPSFR